MTWSIIARDSATSQFGIAVATKFFAVGARVPHIAAGIGGVATQALVNPYYGIDGVRCCARTRAPRIVDALIAATTARAGRLRMDEASLPIPAAIASTGAGTLRVTAFDCRVIGAAPC
jgi:uncharacterized Ntn-hydrolase superfamily protein